ncbi:hypothetical protein [Marinovum sp.]|uniref:hypothetical protein n=1 Tax=Marinovum sp. TaxID=2024839 RepID=UPI002B2728E1|nr:hypothetical protein [Marinovum sp.]
MLLSPVVRAQEGTASMTCDRIAGAARAVRLSPDLLARVVRELGHHDAPESIPATAGQLAALQERFGTPGLAALALAGGPEQAETFLAGNGIPPATVDFVILTTGDTPETWRDNPPAAPKFRLAPEVDFDAACRELILGRWGAPLPELGPLPEAGPVDLALVDPALRSLRPRLRPIPTLATWGAQLAFGTSQDSARANFTRATRACRAAVGQSPDIVFVENRVRGRPGYWMARVSRMQRDAAEEICRAARRKGCSCAVYKNH